MRSTQETNRVRQISKRLKAAASLTTIMVPIIAGTAMADLAYAQDPTGVPDPVRREDITPDTSLGVVMNDPALLGFAEHLLPWAGRDYDPEMPLRDFDRLLPYHTNVNADEIAASLDRIADDTARGLQVFYPIYSDAEIASDPAKRDTGLFFFRGKPGAPFAVVAPGGGFAYVGSVHEGFPYATAINDEGVNAFVVRYRVGQGQVPAAEDMAAAIELILQRAAELGVDTSGYSVWGSSAGARMAALIGSHGVERFSGASLPGSAAVIMAYTSHSDVSGSEPPTYAIVGENDGIAPPANIERRVAALRSAGVDVEFRVVPGVAHGFGSGRGTPAEGWIAEAVAFWLAAR
jgi:acetyl esterase/lipase